MGSFWAWLHRSLSLDDRQAQWGNPVPSFVVLNEDPSEAPHKYTDFGVTNYAVAGSHQPRPLDRLATMDSFVEDMKGEPSKWE